VVPDAEALWCWVERLCAGLTQNKAKCLIFAIPELDKIKNLLPKINQYNQRMKLQDPV
jgi:hypothetical protein